MNKFKLTLLTASMALAMAFTFSCSSDDDGDEDDSISAGPPLAYEGRTYKTVVIGEQTWMAENMNYAVGVSKCYDDEPANCDKYGRLYDWATAKTVCPSDWHLSSAEDWNILMSYVQTDNGSTYTPGEDASIAGKYLKAKSVWYNNGNGKGKYGFAALPGGLGYPDGSFRYAIYNGYWWTSAESDSEKAYNRSMGYSDEIVVMYDVVKGNLFSVRCVKDQPAQ